MGRITQQSHIFITPFSYQSTPRSLSKTLIESSPGTHPSPLSRKSFLASLSISIQHSDSYDTGIGEIGVLETDNPPPSSQPYPPPCSHVFKQRITYLSATAAIPTNCQRVSQSESVRAPLYLELRRNTGHCDLIQSRTNAHESTRSTGYLSYSGNGLRTCSQPRRRLPLFDIRLHSTQPQRIARE